MFRDYWLRRLAPDRRGAVLLRQVDETEIGAKEAQETK